MAIVTPEDRERFFEIIDKWDVEAAVIGTVTGDGRLTIDHFGQRIVDVDPKTVANEGPVYDRPYARPAWQDELQDNTVEAAGLARPETAAELDEALRTVLSDVNQGSKAWVTDQYDRYVQGNTALAQPDDACASTKKPVRAWRWRPMRTAGSPNLTRTRVPARRSRKPIAMSRRWVHAPWQSRTA